MITKIMLKCERCGKELEPEYDDTLQMSLFCADCWDEQANEVDLEEDIEIDRVWAMPNKRTFEIRPIKKLLQEETEFYDINGYKSLILDPFPLEYKEDATIYLERVEDGSYMFGLFDPPYSPRQLKECYNNKGEYDTKASTWSNWKDLMAKKIKVGGKVISFGWNTNGLGMSRGFKIKRILLVAHGGNHNDTICTVEVKMRKSNTSQ